MQNAEPDRDKQTCHLNLFRYDPDKDEAPRLVLYEVPLESGMSVMGVLQYVQDYLDPTLAFEYSCRIGLCQGCWVWMNGNTIAACSTPAEPSMTIKPTREDHVVRDLVVRPPPRSGR